MKIKDQMKLKELLLYHPKIVNQKVQRGATLFHHVCRENQLPQLQRLLQFPTLKLNEQTDLGLTPLMVACQQGKSLIVSELMKHKNVNPNLCDSQKRTTLWLAAKRGNTSLFLSVLCSPHWVIDVITKPEGKKYSQPCANYVEEYTRDTVKFQKKYGGTQSYEHPHPGISFFFLLSHQSLA